MIPHFFVFDDFLKDPHAVRARALELDYSVEGRFPGLNSREKINIEGLNELISALVHEPFALLGPTTSRTRAAG